jgi:glucan biosynthesis protein C
MNSSRRFHDIDALRGLLMILGVFFHTALIYEAGTFPQRFTPLIQDASWWWGFDGLVLASNAVRMPCFFLISGFLLGISLARRPLGQILPRRMLRIVVPLAVGMLVLIPLQGYVIYLERGGGGGFLAQFSDPERYRAFHYFYAVSYLWFLVNLALYFPLFGVLWTRLPLAWRQPAAGLWLQRGLRLAAGPLGWLPWAGLLAACRLVDQQLGLGNLLTYLPLFACGLLGALQPAFFDGLRRITGLRVLALAVAFALYAWLCALPEAQPLLKIGKRLLEGVVALGGSGLILGLGARCVHEANPRLRALADASYSIYLLHQPLVVWLGWLAMELALPAAVKFLGISCFTIGVTVLVHRHAVRRWPICSLLLNGQWRPTPLQAGSLDGQGQALDGEGAGAIAAVGAMEFDRDHLLADGHRHDDVVAPLAVERHLRAVDDQADDAGGHAPGELERELGDHRSVAGAVVPHRERDAGAGAGSVRVGSDRRDAVGAS